MKYFIKTFGCQMNKADSERVAGWYQSRGFLPSKNIKEADEIIINTCSVRKSAEDRVLGLINNLLKTKRAKQKIILTGCMLRYSYGWLKKKMPQVDEFRPVEKFEIHNSEFTIRDSPIHAWVTIMEGCDNFCTYCVVPYARGRERSRPMEEIICEAEELARRGYKEITLLGQNVNSWGKDFSSVGKNKSFFASLLQILHQIEGLEKISFLTSNPWYLTDDVIEAMSLPKVDRYLHLPVQAGDDEILYRMNRKHTAKDYLGLIKKIRRKIPEIEFGTDIIVGFPGETEEQFQHTVELCKTVGFKVAYIAQYSPRPGTAAYKLKDDISAAEKKRRWRILEELINKR